LRASHDVIADYRKPASLPRTVLRASHFHNKIRETGEWVKTLKRTREHTKKETEGQISREGTSVF